VSGPVRATPHPPPHSSAQVTVVRAATTLDLDTRDLHIADAWVNGEEADFTLGFESGALGKQLSVCLPEGTAPGDELEVEVRYRTSPASSALQFLGAGQTAGKAHPFMFSQCQAIHARSMLPCQDTPSVKATYSAALRCPEPLRALMSAVPTGSPEAWEPSPRGPLAAPHAGTATFHFEQRVPVPSYLIAVAVGELRGLDISDRCRVWAEPSVVESARHEFEGTEEFLRTAEEVAGEYVWGRYDLLVLPPSFPYGGMENPCLTFVTPTLLAGDRSLVNVVAHEIAHSWTGNLVTNGSWEHFWLNEGFTVLLERKIIGRLRGEPARQFQASSGFLGLAEAVKLFGEDHNYTRLVPDLSDGADPDDAFSRVPYEKGSYFLSESPPPPPTGALPGTPPGTPRPHRQPRSPPPSPQCTSRRWSGARGSSSRGSSST